MRRRLGLRQLGVLVAIVGCAAIPALAVGKSGETMDKLPGAVWIDGPGYNVTYGVSYEACAAKCLGASNTVERNAGLVLPSSDSQPRAGVIP